MSSAIPSSAPLDKNSVVRGSLKMEFVLMDQSLLVA